MVTVGWGDADNTLMIMRLEMPWSIDDQFKSLSLAFEMIRQENHPVDILIDAREISVSSTYEKLYYQTFMKSYPENLRSIIQIVTPAYAKIVKSIWQLHNRHQLIDIYVESSVDRAYAMLDVIRRQSCIRV